MNNTQFNGFPKQGIQFLTDLKSNNTREWFSTNKPVYQEYVAAPAKAFANDIEYRLIEITQQPMSSKIFRFYRDLRFSKDKTPYNTHVRISFFCADTGNNICGAKPAFHFSLETNKVVVGVGSFDFPKDVLYNYRESVNDEKNGNELVTIMNQFSESDGYHVDEPVLKRIPSGYDKTHPRADLLKRKGLVLWHEQEHSRTLSSTDYIDELMDRFHAMRPVYDWLNIL